MKVIDLLNKIAKGEDVPKKIIYELNAWFYNEAAKDYFKCGGDIVSFQMTYVSNPKWLDFEVETIEEEVKIPTFDDMKDIGTKVGKAYRELFEGFSKGWNTPIKEEKKEIKKINIDEQDRIQALSTGNYVYKVNQPTKNIIYKINEIIDKVNSISNKE